jgi:hypothetical protein
VAKKTQKTTNGKRTLEQREAYHQAALKKIALGKQIKALKQQQKSL